MSFDLKAHLKQLCETPAPSGHEDPVRDVIRAAWAGLVDDCRTDSLGNLIAVQYGTGPEPRRRVMLTAHMDEIGLIVAEIRDGFIRAESVGGIDTRVLLHQPVLVHGQQRTLKGLFGAAPPHMARSRKTYPEADELWIDVGLPHDDMAELVRVGDLITFDAPVIDLKNERLAGKSMDNRVSVAAVTLCLDELRRVAHSWDVVAVATVQEERDRIGAITAAYQEPTDIAIVIDGTFAAQSGASDDDTFALGGGPTIGRGPNFHPLLVQKFRDAAKAHEIKTQVEVLPGDSGTDAWLIQVSRAGILCVLLGIPMRNMHTPVEVVDLRDVRRTARLITVFITGLEPDFLAEIAWPENCEAPK
ncbi:MAG: M42 family peptidase [Anaerolineae bacterium]|nr:M42 family peptidase [Anaerolineae bacterium]